MSILNCRFVTPLVSRDSQAREEGRAELLRGAAEVQPRAPDALPVPPVRHHGQGAACHPLLLLHQHHGGAVCFHSFSVL